MFIDAVRDRVSPPSGGPYIRLKNIRARTNMALLPEGAGASRLRFYKHDPPAEGRVDWHSQRDLFSMRDLFL
jgi:hypothetical protein